MAKIYLNTHQAQAAQYLIEKLQKELRAVAIVGESVVVLEGRK